MARGRGARGVRSCQGRVRPSQLWHWREGGACTRCRCAWDRRMQRAPARGHSARGRRGCHADARKRRRRCPVGVYPVTPARAHATGDLLSIGAERARVRAAACEMLPRSGSGAGHALIDGLKRSILRFHITGGHSWGSTRCSRLVKLTDCGSESQSGPQSRWRSHSSRGHTWYLHGHLNPRKKPGLACWVFVLLNPSSCPTIINHGGKIT